MSLLEDIFLQDEAGEAQELERIIEGDEYDERRRSLSSDSDDHSEKEGEAEEDKRRVDPATTKTQRTVKNPRLTLNPARLTGPRGIQVIPEHFKDFKFTGKGHEKEDLDMVLKKLEHWAHRLYPKFGFEDCLKKIETLGKKRPVMVHLTKIRSDQFISDDVVVQKDSSDDEAPVPPEEDEFDKLLQQQIEIARATPAPGSVTKLGIDTPGSANRSLLKAPKATFSPSISDEQKERMLKNRRLAEERRLARLRQDTENSFTDVHTIENNAITNTTVQINTIISENNEGNMGTNEVSVKKRNRLNVIDSSDDEGDVYKSVRVDVHQPYNNDEVDIIDSCVDAGKNDALLNVRNVHTDNDTDFDVINNDLSETNDDNHHVPKTGDIDKRNNDIDHHIDSLIDDTSEQNSNNNYTIINDEIGDNVIKNNTSGNDVIIEDNDNSQKKEKVNLKEDANVTEITDKMPIDSQNTEVTVDNVMDFDFNDDDF